MISPSGGNRRDIELEIAHLTGEKHTHEARIQWIDKKIGELLVQLHHHYTY